MSYRFACFILTVVIGCATIVFSIRLTRSYQLRDAMIESSHIRSISSDIIECWRGTRQTPHDDELEARYAPYFPAGVYSWRLRSLLNCGPFAFLETNTERPSEQSVSATFIESGVLRYYFGNQLLNGNFRKLETLAFDDVPDFFLIAYTGVPSEEYTWMKPDSSEFSDLTSASYQKIRIREFSLLIFKNGLTGKISASNFHKLEPCFNVDKSRDLTKSDLQRCGVEWSL